MLNNALGSPLSSLALDVTLAQLRRAAAAGGRGMGMEVDAQAPHPPVQVPPGPPLAQRGVGERAEHKKRTPVQAAPGPAQQV